MRSLFVFVDVSGNYDFSTGGTKYIVLTSVTCSDACQGVLELYNLKHELINAGVDIEYFHAAEDKQTVRDAVFNIIAGLKDLRVDSVIVEKRKTAPNIRPIKVFYPKMIEYLLKYLFDSRGINIKTFDRVFIFMDRETSRSNERNALLKALKTSLSRHLGNVPYVICMHSSESHHYLQIVDYCSWAIYVKQERGETRPYDRIKEMILSEFSIFAGGVVNWY